MSTRTYVSPRRDAEAAATRAGIVDAAALLFVRDGYAATPMRAIAALAGVSVQTVHLHGPKHLLLMAAFERAFAGDEGERSLAERPALVEIMSTPDPSEAIAAYVGFLSDANRRAAGLIRALMTAADADPVVRVAYAELESRRRRDMMIAAEWFAGRQLVPDSQLQRTADLIGLYTGPETYLQLVDGSGWSHEAYQDWLSRRLRELDRD